MMLDAEQKRIVESTAKNIVVVAGAGSGKTTVLTQRIRYLIEHEGVIPEDIIAITFTNAAADEMRERLSDIKDVDTMFIGTIHSFANALLQIACPDEYYTVLSEEEFLRAANVLCKKYCRYLTADRIMEYMEIKEKARNGRAEWTDVNDYFEAEEENEFLMMMRKDVNKVPNARYPESIYSWCEDRNILTFDNLIVYAKKNLGKDFSFPYLFVDEYQDVGVLEDGFIRALEADHTFIVGDDWQSIYGFKGANVDIFKSYVKSNDRTVYYLNRNYRSAEGIIKLAETVISDDRDKIDKKVVPVKNEKGTIALEKEEKIVSVLKEIRKNNNYKEWFLLARTRKNMNFIYDWCEMLGIPAVFFSREGLSKEQERELLSRNAVKVATIHGVKGLESDNVLLYGDFPIYGEMPISCIDNRQKMLNWYEERRIMYVGITRAKNSIVILSNENTEDNMEYAYMEYVNRIKAM